MNPDIQQLETRIAILEKKIANLSRSSSIGRDIENALTERLNIAFVVGNGAAPTQSVSVPTTPTSITVPAQPSGSLTVNYKGKLYNLLYK